MSCKQLALTVDRLLICGVYETYFKLVLATGLRRGEACGLKWSDINWCKRTIHVQRGVVKLSHQESITKGPKTTSGDRMVYLSKEMCQLLKAWRKECEWNRQQTANETVSEDDYLFRQPNGKPMNPSTFTYTIFYNGLQWENQRTAFNSFRKSDTHRPMVFAISWWASVVLAYNSLMVAVMGCMRIRLTGLYTASTTAASTTTTITARQPHGTCHAAPK